MNDSAFWGTALQVGGGALLGSLIGGHFRAYKRKKQASRDKPTPTIVSTFVHDPETGETLGWVDQWSDTGEVVGLHSIKKNSGDDS